MAAHLDFWFDFASTYSFLSAKRIDRLAEPAGVSVRWRPFLLGPIFQAQGWASSPFNVYPAKGRYMERDVRRIAATRGHDFAMPDPFPQRSILAARVALAVAETAGNGALAQFSQAVFEAQFEARQSLEDMVMLKAKIALLGIDQEIIFANATTERIKARLRTETEQAQALGVFGAPTFVTLDSELFWGDDRLTEAIAHAATM
jgi:2-hydroxychromene-2-carboxylate isomerase